MLRRNMPSAECQISGSKGRYLVFTLPFFQIPMMTTQHLSTRMIGKKPKNARNCESWASFHLHVGTRDHVASLETCHRSASVSGSECFWASPQSCTSRANYGAALPRPERSVSLWLRQEAQAMLRRGGGGLSPIAQCPMETKP